jgi:intein/homing endonuclease
MYWGKASRLYTIRTESGKTIQCSPSHPLFADLAERNKVAAADLVNDELKIMVSHIKTIDGLEAVTHVEWIDGVFDVITFALEHEDHSYVAGDIVSGNISQK